MLNLALFGSSPYITPLLQVLLASKKLSLAVFVTKPGSGHFDELLHNQPVTVLRPDNLKKENATNIQNALEANKIDIGIVADYGLMLPLSIIKTPPHGLINIHFSILPQYRGASPVQYTILNGEKETAYTFIEMLPDYTPQVDSGRIIHQVRVPLVGDETTETLYTSLFHKASQDIEAVVLAYTHSQNSPIAQEHNLATFTTPTGKFDRTTLLTKNDAYISSEHEAAYIERAIRAFTPWPRAWTTLGELFEIAQRFDPSITKLLDTKDPAIRIQLLKGHLENEKLVLDTVQADGKKPAPWKEFKNGYFE